MCRKLRILVITMACSLAVCGLVLAVAVLKVTTYEIRTEENKTPLLTIEDVPQAWWAELARKKIFFAHRELGDEIIDGMEIVLREHESIKLKIVESTEPSSFDEPVFAHAKIGRCRYPESKLNGLKEVLEAGVGEKTDIVFLKFCYIDVIWETDAEGIFRDYQKMVEELKARYPKTDFLHLTVPLGSKPKRSKKVLREAVKLLIGRPSAFDDNLRRQQYNDLLRETYPEPNSFFDLAFVEAVNPEGLVCSTSVRGEDKVLVKAPEYGSSLSHLGKEERKKIGEQLLIALAMMANAM